MDKELEGRIRASLMETKNKSEETHEKNLTYITAGALAVSMSFISNIVPLHQAHYIWMLISVWGLLTASLLINLVGHKKTAKFSHNALVTFDKTLDDERIEKEGIKFSKKLKAWDWISIWFLGVAIVLLITFCSINIYTMPNETKPERYIPQRDLGDYERRGYDPYIPRAPAEAPAPTPAAQPAQPAPSPQPAAAPPADTVK